MSLENNIFESSRQELLGKTSTELADLIAEQFDDFYPSDGLYAGTFQDRVWEFVLNHVRGICDEFLKRSGEAAELAKDVWDALNDDRTAHNAERFALVCSFFSSYVLQNSHWPTHEIAALVLLIVSILPRKQGSL